MQVEKKEIIDQVVEEVKAEIKEPVVTEVAKTFEQEKSEFEAKQKQIDDRETQEYITLRNELDQRFKRRTIAIYFHQDGGVPGFQYAVQKTK